MAVEALEYLKRELEKIADEATTDCYNEYEQIACWCAYLEDQIDLPCECKVAQKEGLLIGFDTNKDGSCLLAVAIETCLHCRPKMNISGRLKMSHSLRHETPYHVSSRQPS
jgi:Calcium binding